ncbi:sensor domain-containing phosphodiesterase [Caldimonas taiwanensis]|uniref:sensor domain-containing phosphodiesterase n=1 Tax=Caldimonas taiwanensis TaxID=307483 RepID=UPI000780306F|nr:EAL domain-containing protein [Caldimonas taiwanensis]
MRTLLNAVQRVQDGRWTARHARFELHSHFQPIYSLSHHRAVGHEALLRAVDAQGRAVAPPSVLAAATSPDDLVHLDRLCRLLHVANFSAQAGPEPAWLFLNIHPAVFVRGPGLGGQRYMRAMLDRFALPPSQVVLEVTEDMVRRDQSFEAAMAEARELGCLLALDDFGAGHSNFDRVWHIRPEIVKLDRSLVRRAAMEPRIGRIATQMVSLLHACGAMVLMEGIETLDEAYLALQADVDFVQGYLFAPPAPVLQPPQWPHPVIDAVWQRFDARFEADKRAERERLAPYMNAIGHAAALLQAGLPLEACCQEFLRLPGAELCYLIDEQGLQIGHNVTSPHFEARRSAQFAPLRDARGARWARRPYFRRALDHIGRVQVTRPYLTVHGAHLCVTVSIGLRWQERLVVLGGDIDWDIQPALG